jgi:hypothetical protein
MKRFLFALCLTLAVSTLSFAQPIDFQYLGAFDAQGVPAYLTPAFDVVGADLLADIAKALPENQPVPAVHPEYIQAANETDIKLYKEASVWVTLVNEVAGYTNAFGFYTYPIANPPHNTGEIQKHTIIFPNVSLSGSGGGLNSGNKVLLGKFPANTGIGWFIVADAFKEGKVTAGKYILYSEPAFNPEPEATLKSHTVLFNDAKRNKVILGFEDVRRDQGSDQDFNDLLFYISADPYTAIKTDSLLNLDGSPSTAATVINNTTNNNTVNNNINNKTNNNTVSVSNTAVNNTVNTNANTNSNNNNGNSNSNNNTTIVNNTTIINNNNGNNNSNTNNASGTSGNSNATNTGQTSGNNGNAGNTQGNGQHNGNNNTNTSQPAFTSCSRNGIPSSNFENLRTTIKAQRVESNKPTVIKQAVSNYQVTVSQVKEMLRLISVEQYRLDMAKYLYDYTCDQANYFEVNGLLNSGRVRDLEEYLKKKRGNSQPSNGQTYNQQQNTTYENDHSGNTHSHACANGSMSERDFDDLQSMVRSISFSDSKQNVIKEAVPGHCISAVQVKQLMSLFSFEADKLAVAKYLYSYTSDQQNYFKVNEAFSFSTSVDELKKYISGQ